MRRLTLVLFVFLAGILGVILAQIVYDRWYVIDVVERDVVFTVVEGEHIGFALDTDKLYLGKVPQGGSSERKFQISSQIPATAHIEISDNLAEWISVEQRVELSPDERARVVVYLTVPSNATPGNYTGTMRVTYVRRFS